MAPRFFDKGLTGLAAVLLTAAFAVEASAVSQVVERSLPDDLRWASDVRWASDDSVWIAAGSSGVFEVSIADPAAPPRRLEANGKGPDGLLLAASDGVVAAAVGFGPVSWARVATPNLFERTAHLATIVDFDLWQDRGIFLGARRGPKGEWAPEGGLLWHRSIGTGFSDVEPALFADGGPGALEVAFCGTLGLGAVRFFPDGRYAVVPGVQAGAYLYAADGKLLKAWKTEGLGFYDRCELDWDEARPVKADPRARLRWWRRHATLDEIVPWGEWPALIVRRPRDEGTAWQLVVLSATGASDPIDLPVESASTGSHVKADVRGDRLVLLVSEFAPPDEPPQAPPRLVVLRRTEER